MAWKLLNSPADLPPT